ncbi:polyamine-modulated factor 1-binding protein 1-like isoform X2 [Ambystoma mexicanum]|uniref:polyamine-modulated factor 1-binding protein 1-like isoform X2 n=1 Tax=Ambystoma mexicanum TaxID=8296 RepID=UPI0037E917A7
MKTCSDDFKSQLAAKDKVIHCLQEDLSKALFDRDHAINELQRKNDELQRRQKETLPRPQKEDGLLAELQSQERIIYQLQAEDSRSKSELRQWEAKVGALQTELDGTRKQLEERKRQCDGQPTSEDHSARLLNVTHWHDAFLTVKSDFIELEKKYLDAVAQLKEKSGLTKQLGLEISNSKSKLDDTNKELEEVHANLGAALQEYDMARAEVNCKEDLIRKLNEEYKEKRKEHELKVTLLEDELSCIREEHDCSQKEISRLEKVITALRKELTQLQFSYEQIVESNGRLKGKIESHVIIAQNEEDVLSNEILCKEDIIHKLKMQQISHEEKLSVSEEKIQQHKKMIELLHQKNLDAADLLRKKEERIYSLEQQLKEDQVSRKDAILEANECRETINNLRDDLASLKSAENSARKAVLLTEHVNSELTQECAHLKHMLGEMQFKLSSSEKKVGDLSSEVGMLKSKVQKKSEDVQKLEDQIMKHQVALNKANVTLKDTKKAAANKIYVRESKHESLQKELADAQDQYSSCYDELLHREKVLQKLKEENDELMEQIKQKSQIIIKMGEERRKLELDLTIVLEKHKTAQQEVCNRDQIILHLKTDLKTSQEEYFGSQEELGLQEAEVARLNQKLKSLQTEVRDLWEKCSVQEDQLTSTKKENQQLQHDKEIHVEQIESKRKLIDQLQSDLELTKQSHSADLERWNQKASLLQKELDSAATELQENLAKMQDHKKDCANTRNALEKAESLHQEALSKVRQGEETLRKRNFEIAHLQKNIEGLERKRKECYNQAKASESAADLFKQKYQAGTDAILMMESRVQDLEKEVNEYREEIAQKIEVIHSLETEILKLQNNCTEKKDQVDTFEELMDQLTEELQSTQEELSNHKEHSSQYSHLVETLNSTIASLQKQLSEKEDTLLQLNSTLTQYQSTHGHANEEFDAQAFQTQYFQEEFCLMSSQWHEATSKVGEYERVIQEQKEEAANVLNQQKKYVLEIEKLEKTLQSLHLDIMASQQKHKVGHAQLEQQITQLERDLADARKLCSQKEQALQKRDDLLRKSEADLMQAREGIRAKVSEVEHLDSVVRSLKASIQDTQKEKAQKEKDNLALKLEVQQLGQELQEVHRQYRGTAQELASQDEKLLLVQSSLRATQEQLTERIAETVRQEQSSRKLHIEMKTLRERVAASEEETRDYKEMLEKLKAGLAASKSEQQSKLHEARSMQQSSHKLEVELASASENVKALQQQVQKYEDLGRCLREELKQEQSRHQEQQKQMGQLKQHAEDLEAEVANLRTKQKNDAQTLQDREQRLFTLEEDIGHIQEKHRCAREELLEVQSQLKMAQMNLSSCENQLQHHCKQAKYYEDAFTNMKHDLEQSKEQCRECTRNLKSAENEIHDLKIELSSLEATHKETADKVEHLRNALNASEKKHDEAQHELEALRRALEAARTDSSRLHQESELVVANVNQWIKEQTLANENLGEKFREQNKHLIQLAAEKDHMQEIKDALTKEIKKLNAEYEETKIENEQLKAFRTRSANQEALLSQLRGQLEVQEHEQTSLMTEKMAAMEDMHTRLRTNIESIHLLNEQLNTLSNENVQLKQRWEDERRQCQQLDLQLKTCSRTISNLQIQLEDGRRDAGLMTNEHRDAPACTLGSSSALCSGAESEPTGLLRAFQMDALTQQDLEQTRGEASMDKSYWIQRVGELSTELQESTEYWTGRMNQLTHGIQHSRLASPKK